MLVRQSGQNKEALSCSFCLKSRDSVQKLIGSPSLRAAKAYVSDGCVAVCASILDDDRDPSDVSAWKAESHESHPLLNHPLTPQLLAAVERWIGEESLGADASEELAKVRAIAIRLMLPDASSSEVTTAREIIHRVRSL
jgi:hypothetical protein